MRDFIVSGKLKKKEEKYLFVAKDLYNFIKSKYLFTSEDSKSLCQKLLEKNWILSGKEIKFKDNSQQYELVRRKKKEKKRKI